MNLDINLYWSGISILEKIYWIVALPSTVIFLIQFFMTLFAGDTDTISGGDSDISIDSDHGITFQYLSLKNITAFFTIFSWSGIACIKLGINIPLTVIISIICGLIMLFIMIGIYFLMGKLTENGNFNINNSIDKICDTYLPIPAARKGMGKVQINVQGNVREIDAVTDEETDIKTGTIVQVTEVINNQILLVKTLNKK